ncbi:tetratricopeptide repeat protein [Nonomuraea salmonea]|uniref:tetratricopeptide repeat protein n=1 Tax=Nonomuraea salmonea TaxID=46181 RepID=UPI0031E7081F
MTREHLDRLLEQALLADDHDSLASRLYDVALDYSSGDVSRASILVLAAEEWRAAGQPARAMECFQRAVEDGGDAGFDARAGIADTLFELDRPDEAREVIETIRAEGNVSTATAHTIAETLVAYGDLQGGSNGPPRPPSAAMRTIRSRWRCCARATASGSISGCRKTSSTSSSPDDRASRGARRTGRAP